MLLLNKGNFLSQAHELDPPVVILNIYPREHLRLGLRPHSPAMFMERVAAEWVR